MLSTIATIRICDNDFSLQIFRPSIDFVLTLRTCVDLHCYSATNHNNMLLYFPIVTVASNTRCGDISFLFLFTVTGLEWGTKLIELGACSVGRNLFIRHLIYLRIRMYE